MFLDIEEGPAENAGFHEFYMDSWIFLFTYTNGFQALKAKMYFYLLELNFLVK